MQSDTPPDDAPEDPAVPAPPARPAGATAAAAAPRQESLLSPAPGKPAEEEKKKKEGWWETIRFFLILFVAAVAIRSLLFAPFSIPSGSMLPNLMIGDYLFVSKWPYGYSRFSFPFGVASFDGRIFGGVPERGDVVVFRYPGPVEEDYVKRVIGLPGDRIEVRAGVVVLNGRPIPRRRIADYAMPLSPNSPCRGGGGTRGGAADA